MSVIWDARYHNWRCRRRVNGRIMHATFTYKDNAIEWDRNMERRAAGLEPLPRDVTLAQGWALYQEQLEVRGSSETTFRYYECKYKRLEEWFTPVAVLNRIDKDTIQAYLMTRRRASVGNRTIKHELSLLRRITVRSEVEPAWRTPQLRVLDPRRVPPAPEEAARLWRELHGPELTAFGLCLLAGMRASETLRATRTDYDEATRTLALTGRKTSDELVVPVVPTLAALLPRSGRLVPDGESALASGFRRAAQRAGLRSWIGPGLGRHAHATWAIAYGGFTSQHVADALGHALPGAATPRYIHAGAVEPMRRPVAKLVEKTLLAALAALDSGGRTVQFAGRRPPADVRICANRVLETTWKSIGGAERT